ncbi:4'-phosphopantetheinyl transferase superfamily protein [Paenibacillus sp. PCH8]|uniref:4'-phosphopantetheinyl transferase family protein n=1 Tax=Paenibacillus sp. PCH8 TaxID=2066524 RepID=UPI0015E44926|nr:4'-phosphopantetheinyl transferase superfamily protein [Paenibacillus sp. PCH8]
MDSNTRIISRLLTIREQGNEAFTATAGAPEIHIWTQGLPIMEEQLQTMDTADSSALSSDEYKRLVRMKKTSRLVAHCWMVSRIFLRRVLAEYVQLHARDIHFQYGTAGKPYLPGGPQFSLSHTKGLCMLAVTSTNNELGVDVEWMRPLVREQAVVQRFLTEEEQDYLLEGLRSGDDTSILLWKVLTGKEAWIKASGQSLCGQWRKLNTVQVMRNHGQLLEWAGQNYVMQSLNIGKGYSASLCMAGAERVTVRWMNTTENEIY